MNNKVAKIKYITAFLIAVVVLAVYLPALRNDFVTWDDNGYVLDNAFIRHFNLKFIKRAFLGFDCGNWHPLTWISHALDYYIWRLNPMGHHLTNIILHAINSCIVSLLAVRLLESAKERAGNDPSPETTLTDSNMVLIGAITGLLFGLHPLHVESVAWVSERKDLLCALFFLLSIMSYTKYQSILDGQIIQRDSFPWFSSKAYLVTVILFILSLMSKPMAVSLPLVLLIIDWYPFQRIRSFKTFGVALLEKLPFLVLSLFSSIVTMLAQKDAMSLVIGASLKVRLAVAARSLILYLYKIMLPLNLVPYYPYPERVLFLSPAYLLPPLLVVIITLVARRRKLCLAAWLYFVIALVPVLGIVQVGMQSMADRYTYLPSIGPFLVAGVISAAGYDKLVSRRRTLILRGAGVATALVFFIFLSYLTIQQIGVWKNGLVFWKYVVKKEPEGNFTAHCNLGYTYQAQGLLDLAIEQYQISLRMRPDLVAALMNLGNTYQAKGLPDKAIEQYNIALKLAPNYEELHNNLGVAYQAKGLSDMAIQEYLTALRLRNNDAKTDINLADAYRSKGLQDKAVEQYLISLQLDPDNAEVHNNLANMFLSRSLFDMAIRHYQAALKLQPDYAEAHNNLGAAYQAKGLTDMAIEQYRTALRLQPDYARAHFNLGKAYAEKGAIGPARKEFETALKLKPDYSKAREALRKIRST